MFRIVRRLIKWADKYKKRMYLGFVYSFLHAMFTAFPIVLAAYALNLILNDYMGEKALSPFVYCGYSNRYDNCCYGTFFILLSKGCYTGKHRV